MIKFEQANKIFAKKVCLENINLTISPQEFILFTGNSGSGKTILLELILQNHSISSGKFTSTFNKNEIIYLPQSVKLLNDRNIWQNLNIPLLFQGISNADITICLNNILKNLHLLEKKYFYPQQLSQGEKQCCCIARTIISKAKFIIMDNPFVFLDKKQIQNIMQILISHHKAYKPTIILTSNNENFDTKLYEKIRSIHLENHTLTRIQSISNENNTT